MPKQYDINQILYKNIVQYIITQIHHYNNIIQNSTNVTKDVYLCNESTC